MGVSYRSFDQLDSLLDCLGPFSIFASSQYTGRGGCPIGKRPGISKAGHGELFPMSTRPDKTAAVDSVSNGPAREK